MQLLHQNATTWIHTRIMKEWNKLKEARTGTLKNRGYRLAQAVLSREDPRETFLKAVPVDGGYLEIFYPDVYSEKIIRRRLRVMSHRSVSIHRKRLIWWSILLLIQSPLMLTPLPNITVYYTLYRVWSHSRALQGCTVLDKGFAALDSKQLEELREKLIEFQEVHSRDFPKGSWPYQLLHKDKSYLDIFDRMIAMHKKRKLEQSLKTLLEQKVPSAKSILDPSNMTKSEEYIDFGPEEPKQSFVDSADQSRGHEIFDTGLHLMFNSSPRLSSITNPPDRLNNPLSDEAAIEIGREFGIPGMLKEVARARKLVIGSFFPSDSREW